MRLYLHTLSLLLLLLGFQELSGQYGSVFKTYSRTCEGDAYHCYDFEMEGQVKCIYFVQNANRQFKLWKKGKEVLLVCAGGFSETWKASSKPIGLTVENGKPMNKSMHYEMDGLVLVRKDKITAIDLDDLQAGIRTQDGSRVSIHPRKSHRDRNLLVQIAKEEGISMFQTQLLYAQGQNKTYLGKGASDKKERRFLVLGRRGGKRHNLILDAPHLMSLRAAALCAVRVLKNLDFQVDYLLNLDTGGKNILAARKGGKLVYQGPVGVEEATNLLVFYR